MSDFARGARIKPRAPHPPEVPINEEMSFPEFMVYMAIYAVRDYKVDRVRFLKYAAVAFDGVMSANPTSAASEKP